MVIVSCFTTKSIAQTISNNTACDITVEISCLDLTVPGCWYNIFTTIIVVPGSIVPYSVPCSGTDVLFHFYFSGGCNTNDPFVAEKGNCLGLPDTDIMYSNSGCNCPNAATIQYLGGGNWEVN